jgi:CRISPR/Cas system-associated endonuclease/helicase Cas3
LPSKYERAPKSSKEKGSNFLTLSKFEKESKNIGVVYMLVIKEKEKFDDVPFELEPLLEEFKDVQLICDGYLDENNVVDWCSTNL